MTPYDALLDVAKRANKEFAPLTEQEGDSEYLVRLATAVSGTTKEVFDAMPQEAQDWFDRTADAVTAGQSVPLPVGYDRHTILSPPPPPKPSLVRPRLSAVETPPQQPESPTPQPGLGAAPAPEAPPPLIPPATAPTYMPFSTPPGHPEPVQTQPPVHTPAPEPAKGSRGRAAPPKQTRGRPQRNGGDDAVPGPNSSAGISGAITKMLIKDRNLKVGDLVAQLKEQYNHDVQNPATLQSTRYSVLKTLELAEQMGWRPPQQPSQ